MFQRFFMTAAVAATIIGTGCEWTSSSGGGSWNDAYSWVDFSGVYRNPDGGPLVTGIVSTPGSTAKSVPVVGEKHQNTSNAANAYAGNFKHRPIEPGSVRVIVPRTVNDVVVFVDDGAGNLTSSSGSGSIAYATGTWNVQLNGTPNVQKAITASYSYLVDAVAGTVQPGNSGVAVQSITVNQSGNRISMTDSRGMAFSGQVSGTSGTSDPAAPGNVRLVFDVANANGSVRINGSFSGDWSGSDIDTHGVLSNRRMEGTWIEKGVQGDINGVSGSVSLTPRNINTP